jgi:hypothetical protein
MMSKLDKLRASNKINDRLQDSVENFNMAIETRKALKNLIDNPSKDKLEDSLGMVEKDTYLTVSDKEVIIEKMKHDFIGLFSFDNCPDDYEDLKREAKFLAGITQYSFVLMAQRLKKIRDGRLFTKDGYHDFKTFIEKEMPVNRSSSYNYINLIECFGVQALGHDDIDYSKLIPVIPLLKSNQLSIPKDEIKYQFLNKAKSESFREIVNDVKVLKKEYGFSDNKKDHSYIEKFISVLKKKSNHSESELAKLKELNDLIKSVIS